MFYWLTSNKKTFLLCLFFSRDVKTKPSWRIVHTSASSFSSISLSFSSFIIKLPKIFFCLNIQYCHIKLMQLALMVAGKVFKFFAIRNNISMALLIGTAKHKQVFSLNNGTYTMKRRYHSMWRVLHLTNNEARCCNDHDSGMSIRVLIRCFRYQSVKKAKEWTRSSRPRKDNPSPAKVVNDDVVICKDNGFGLYTE